MSGRVAKRIRRIAKSHAKTIATRLNKPFELVYQRLYKQMKLQHSRKQVFYKIG